MTLAQRIKNIAPYIFTVPFSAALGFFGAAGVYLYPHHNAHYQERGNEIFEKVDGLFSYTRVTRYASGSGDVARFSKGGVVRRYIDQNQDGILDVLKVPEVPIALYRKNDLDSYRITFNKANRDFQEQLERFAPVLKVE